MAKDRRAILTIRGRCPCPDANAGGRNYVSFYLTAGQKRTGSKTTPIPTTQPNCTLSPGLAAARPKEKGPRRAPSDL